MPGRSPLARSVFVSVLDIFFPSPLSSPMLTHTEQYARVYVHKLYKGLYTPGRGVTKLNTVYEMSKGLI